DPTTNPKAPLQAKIDLDRVQTGAVFHLLLDNKVGLPGGRNSHDHIPIPFRHAKETITSVWAAGCLQEIECERPAPSELETLNRYARERLTRAVVQYSTNDRLARSGSDVAASAIERKVADVRNLGVDRQVKRLDGSAQDIHTLMTRCDRWSFQVEADHALPADAREAEATIGPGRHLVPRQYRNGSVQGALQKEVAPVWLLLSRSQPHGQVFIHGSL